MIELVLIEGEIFCNTNIFKLIPFCFIDYIILTKIYKNIQIMCTEIFEGLPLLIVDLLLEVLIWRIDDMVEREGIEGENAVSILRCCIPSAV
jgi:hypothetical protein